MPAAPVPAATLPGRHEEPGASPKDTTRELARRGLSLWTIILSLWIADLSLWAEKTRVGAHSHDPLPVAEPQQKWVVHIPPKLRHQTAIVARGVTETGPEASTGQNLSRLTRSEANSFFVEWR